MEGSNCIVGGRECSSPADDCTWLLEVERCLAVSSGRDDCPRLCGIELGGSCPRWHQLYPWGSSITAVDRGRRRSGADRKDTVTLDC